MKTRTLLIVLLAVQVVTVVFSIQAVASAQGVMAPPSAALGTAFAYQGSLLDGGAAPTGQYDFQFRVFDSPSSIAPIGLPVIKNDLQVTNGVFTTEIDFGAVIFTGEARYLEIGIRPGTSFGGYDILAPRQVINPAPYALFASSAPWAGLTGIPTVWNLTGNSATGSTNFLGTTDNQALELRVNGGRALQLQPNATSPNIVGGHAANSAGAGVHGASVGGGGTTSFGNSVTDNYGTVAGGVANRAGNNDVLTSDKPMAAVGGGEANVASGAWSTVPGGRSNSAAGDYSFAAGRRATVETTGTGSFAWADSQDANFSVNTADQFAIRAANGVRVSENAGAVKQVSVGERYRDNGVIAWGQVLSGGGLSGGGAAGFGVTSATNIGTGAYRIILNNPGSGLLVPIAIADMVGQPTATALTRHTTIERESATTFLVYIQQGNFAAVNNGFVFVVFGR